MSNNLRSLLFVPATERRLKKIGSCQTDAYIIDLEDSISQEDKESALLLVKQYLKVSDNVASNMYVRINKDRRQNELSILNEFPVGVVLPKFDLYDDYADVQALLNDRFVIAMIESPKALFNAERIAALPWVNALAFGAEDFTSISNMYNSYENLIYPKSVVSLAAKANGKKSFDSPCFHIHDELLLQEELNQALRLGFDGKLAIHPKQLGVINQSYEMGNIDCFQRIIDIFEKSGNAVCEIDGQVYEKMHVDRMKRIISSSVNNIQQ